MRGRAMAGAALRMGLVTGAAMSALMFLIFFAWDAFHLVWPLAFVPLFVTGVYAVRASGSRRASEALAAGAIAGFAAGVVSTISIAVVSYLGRPGTGMPYPYWNLFPTLTEGPFDLSGNQLLVDLPFQFPFPWFFRRAPLPDGTELSRLPWTYFAFVPVGVGLSALQAWGYQRLVDADLASWIVARIARVRAAFQSKLLTGFAILTVMIFVTGWLGFASTEEMHQRLHSGRAMEHWLDHAVQLQNALREQDDAFSRLTDAGAPERARSLGAKIAADLSHLATIPPPPHPNFFVGPALLRAEAEKRLPRVQEANRAYKVLGEATTRLLELSAARGPAVAVASADSLVPLRRAVEAPLRGLENEVDVDLVTWTTAADKASHGQQLIAMVLLLLAAGVAFPLGSLFAQVVVRPVTRVGRGLERIGRGDFSHHVDVENRDELGELASRVNEMGKELDRLYTELRGLNENLQQKVQEQLREIERSRMLRRYLPHQVADAIIASGDESILQTHRREITVIFCDLRGFTAFAETAEPEVVMAVLREYHDAVGELINRFQGTLEHFAGDGVMVYFNDPIPAPDHLRRAVRMAVVMRDRVGELAKGWRKLGFELDFGVGIALGYATMGTIGFEGRHDYGAIGSVANLASRLSDEAKGGQILVSQRVYALVEDGVEAQPAGSLSLKGFLKPVVAYNVVALREPVPAA